MAEGKRFDLGTLLMVLVLLCILVAGLWMTGKALDARFDEMNIKLTTSTDQIQGDIAKLRAELRAARPGKAMPAPSEAPAPEVVKKKAK
jgi:hypothetical protein